MQITEHIAALRHEGESLATAAADTELNAPIPTCPEWQMRDLLLHTSLVHRWAAAHVVQRRTQPLGQQEEDALVGKGPGDSALVDWFREGHAALIHALESADPDFNYWTFLPAPSPLAFWARRQAHETAIHRADAESARGTMSAFPPVFAADGLDELLFGFVSRPGGRLHADPPRTIQVRAPDAGRDWLVRIGPEGAEVRGEHGSGDCLVSGPASDLYLLLWNRATADILDVSGDATLLDLWRQSVQIRWG